MLEKNKVYRSEITDITSEGNGVCKIDNIAVFVPDTACGDVLDVKIVKVLKNFCYGIIDKLITPSPDRTENECPVYKKCGGCVFRHISYEAECRIKNDIIRNAFRRIGGLDPVFDDFTGADDISRYRNKAQYPLAVQDGKAVCGFYAPRSHRVIPVEDCPLQPEVFSDIIKCCLDHINKNKLPVYNENDHSGVFRHIYIRKGNYSGSIMVCFVLKKEIPQKLLTPLKDMLCSRFPDICSIIININPDNTNVILGKKWKTLYGKFEMTDTMCGNKIQISPPSFYQVNTVQAEKLYRKALEYAAPKPDDTLADLYCGAGTIGLSMAENVSHLIGIEIVPEAVENARINAGENNILNAEFFCGDAGKIFAKLRSEKCSPDIIVVDPPRKGCSQDTLNLIADAAPEKIIMISCNPATAARDAQYLDSKGFHAVRVAGFDLFPRTGHVECVVLMSRDKA